MQPLSWAQRLSWMPGAAHRASRKLRLLDDASSVFEPRSANAITPARPPRRGLRPGIEPVSSGRVVMDGADVTHKEPGERDVDGVPELCPQCAHDGRPEYRLSAQDGEREAAEKLAFAAF